MKSNKITAIVYLLIMFATMAVSGLLSSKTIYDTYYARQVGAIVTVTSLEQAKEFFEGTLNFSPSTPAQNVSASSLTFVMPGGNRLIVQEIRENSVIGGSNILIRVRNGFQELRTEISRRSNGVFVSEITPRAVKGEEFTVYDSDGNIFTYFRD